MNDAPTALLTDPSLIFAFLAATLGFLFWLSGRPALKTFFTYLPAVIWAYFLPMFATTAGLLPDQSTTYSWMSRYLLPFSLFLLMMTVDLRAIFRLGRVALLMMLAGTLGVVIGGPLAYLIFKAWLPADAWMGFAALSGSWIGGGANMIAVAESVKDAQGMIDWEIPGPVIVIDTVVGYGWMGVLLALSAVKDRFDRWVGADLSVIEAANARLGSIDEGRLPITIADFALILGLGFGAAALSVVAGQAMPDLRVPDPATGQMTTIIGSTTWTVLIVVTAGLVLSFTRLRELERFGASHIGYVALFLLLTSIGARADLATILQTPVYFLAGIVWISVHILILFGAARLLRAPLFFVATGSMANIGGAVSAPIVAGVYYPAMAPIGLLMAVAGYIVGIYAAQLCATILQFLA